MTVLAIVMIVPANNGTERLSSIGIGNNSIIIAANAPEITTTKGNDSWIR
jgi:hypothetical protein